MRTACIISLLFVLIPIGGVLADQPRGIDELVKALDAEDTRSEAIRELEDLGLDAGPAVSRLAALLDSPDKATRAAAADALGAIGKDATAAIPKLVALLGEGELPRIIDGGRQRLQCRGDPRGVWRSGRWARTPCRCSCLA